MACRNLPHQKRGGDKPTYTVHKQHGSRFLLHDFAGSAVWKLPLPGSGPWLQSWQAMCTNHLATTHSPLPPSISLWGKDEMSAVILFTWYFFGMLLVFTYIDVSDHTLLKNWIIPLFMAYTERSKTERGSKGPGLALTAGAHNVFLLERCSLYMAHFNHVFEL